MHCEITELIMFRLKKDHKNNKEFNLNSGPVQMRKSFISSENVQILKVCVQSISQIRYQCHVNLGYLFFLYGHEESSSDSKEFVLL